MKKKALILLIILLNFNFSFSQTETTKGKNVDIRIISNKNMYHIGDTIHLKIIFDNNTNNDLLIAFREGSFHFPQLKIFQNDKQLGFAGICRDKQAPLGFWESDYYKLDSKSSLEFELNLEVISFPIKRNCFEESIYKSDYGILCGNYGLIFKDLGELKIVFEYNVQFPSSKKESIHSAYNKKNNVWKEKLISNTINIKLKNN